MEVNPIELANFIVTADQPESNLPSSEVSHIDDLKSEEVDGTG